MNVLLSDTGELIETGKTIMPTSIITVNDKLYRCVCWKAKKKRGKFVDYALAEPVIVEHYYTDGAV